MFWKLKEWAEGQGRAWQRAAPQGRCEVGTEAGTRSPEEPGVGSVNAQLPGVMPEKPKAPWEKGATRGMTLREGANAQGTHAGYSAQ